uniref:BHLH domain-containing protein n=1 Tax=Ananas comosus var. bracteatus TaxID=296719 RepID=A0A6V7QQ53_ANACO|nr:unnamed protein product [Ananas comosus var. bracteatus]
MASGSNTRVSAAVLCQVGVGRRPSSSSSSSAELAANNNTTPAAPSARPHGGHVGALRGGRAHVGERPPLLAGPRPPPRRQAPPQIPHLRRLAVEQAPPPRRRRRRRHGTLEAVVDQATRPQLQEVGPSVDLLAWISGSHPSPSAAAADLLVPCGEAVAGGRKRGRGSAATASQGSAAPGRGESALATFDTSGGGDEVCFTPTTTTNTTTNNNTSASLGSPGTENTSFGQGGGCYDSVCHSRRPPQKDGVCNEEEKAAKREAGRSSSSAKKSRAAAVHNQSERKRRDRINQRMNTLQKLVPNSSKTDKASMLDEVIEYVKQLQAQVQMMNRMSGMLMPMTMPPPLQMSMIGNMANMAQMAQMGMGMGMMDLSSLGRTGQMGLPSLPPLLHPSAFLPIMSPSWDGSGDRLQQPSGPSCRLIPSRHSLHAKLRRYTRRSHISLHKLWCILKCPMSMDAYNRMAALYQQLYQQNTQSNSKP